ncbi:hypothetical protein ABZ816_01515 [Actinosynnema sp. NPDC047251]|uniref:Uncharacterized protein n=1 Tax=Saccharothrix espanaensis (strain ATCC 51144 / DSM 44229 / JCM 9112 / NBRC 15066 / NRRL 15764) TaxID=1179773 RepID=K0K228_SACES|nr:hypothetical protein [Saccharothrix espanaensis]CCH30929.1 hypothetical protein BN6_36340 [Saccharothrix espanaensis DSM 44229]
MVDQPGVRNELHGQPHGPTVQAGSIGNLWLTSGERAGERPADLFAAAASRAREFVLAAHDLPGAVALDQLTEDVRDLARAQPRVSPDQVLAHVVQAQRAAFALLDTCRNPGVRRRLYFLAGIVGAMLARAAHECGDPRGAGLHARVAFQCAEHADHDGLRARVRALQAAVAYWCGRPHEALRHARSGAVFAERAGSTMAARLPVSEARAWAVLGDVRRTLDALRRAERAWERVRPDELDEFGGVCAFTWSRHLHFAANALTWLTGEAVAVERYATAAVAAYGDRSTAEWAFGSHAGAHTDLAIARLRRHDLPGAAEALAPVLDLPPPLRISTIVLAVRRVRQHLPAARSDLHERVATFARTPLDALSS